MDAPLEFTATPVESKEVSRKRRASLEVELLRAPPRPAQEKAQAPEDLLGLRFSPPPQPVFALPEAQHWSAEEGPEVVVEEVVEPAGLGMVRMPSYTDAGMRNIFYNTCVGEYPTGEYLASKWKQTMKTSLALKDSFWIFSSATQLWEATPLHEVKNRVHKQLALEVDILAGYVMREGLKFSKKKGPGASLKVMWQNVRRRVETTVSSYNSSRGLDTVVKVLFEKLIDEEFVASFDSRRDILSCANGVLELRTLTLVPRTAEHRLTYALPTPYDPAADTSDIETYVRNLYEDPVAERAFHVMAGYYATGETSVKRMWQWSCPSGGGKTSLLLVLCAPLGRYALRGVLPAIELQSGHPFQDRLADALESHPKPRLITVDELKPRFPLAEELVNQLTDGTDDQRIQLGRKGLKHSLPVANHAKLVLCSNHVIEIPAGATGLSLRNTGIGLRFTFVKGEPVSVLERPENPVLKARLLHPSSFAGTLRWLAQGASMFYTRESDLMCLRFEESSFDLRMRGDPYLAWLADTHTPVAEGAEKVSYDDLVRAYRAAGRAAGTSTSAYTGIKTMLDTMSSVLVPVSWAVFDTVVKGVSHLRERRLEDPSWAQAMYALQAAPATAE